MMVKDLAARSVLETGLYLINTKLFRHLEEKVGISLRLLITARGPAHLAQRDSPADMNDSQSSTRNHQQITCQWKESSAVRGCSPFMLYQSISPSSPSQSMQRVAWQLVGIGSPVSLGRGRPVSSSFAILHCREFQPRRRSGSLPGVMVLHLSGRYEPLLAAKGNDRSQLWKALTLDSVATGGYRVGV
jgi:hypothetical protein